MRLVSRVALAAFALAGASVVLAGAAEARAPRLGAAPNFALTTQQNARVWPTHLRGRTVVLTFGCITCGGCPGMLPGVRDLARSVGAAAGRRLLRDGHGGPDPRHAGGAAALPAGARARPLCLAAADRDAGRDRRRDRRCEVTVRRAPPASPTTAWRS